MAGLALGILGAAVKMASLWTPDYYATDFVVLRECGRRFWASGSPYADWQLTGPYTLATDAFVYPPTALAVVAPFAFLPAALWWVIPLGLLGWFVIRAGPAAWTWPLLALCILWPRTVNAVIVGGSDLWLTAGIALALRHRAIALLVPMLKPSVVPVALLAVRAPRWSWAIVAVGGGVLLTAPLWPQYVTALGNMPPVSLAYSLPSLPMYLLPVVAWVGRSVPEQRPEGPG